MARWDFLADQKPVPIREAVLDLVAEDLTKALRAFPPEGLEWEDERQRLRFEPVLAREGKPELDTLRVACELARLELLREYEQIDRFWRGPAARELLPTALEEETAHFVTRWLVDSALSFQEAVPGRFRRAELSGLIERVEDRLLRGFRFRL